MLRLSLLVLIAVLAPGLVRADAPAYVPIQGFLSSATGEPTDGATMLRLRLYDRAAPTGAADEILFEETQTVNVSKGYFTAYLGDGAPLSLALFRDHAIVFVGIRVANDTDELKPLLQLASAPFAGFANACGDSNTVGGKTLQEIVSAATPAAGSPSKGGGSVGPAGPAGPAGPQGDPGVLSVVANGTVSASLDAQTLTINSHTPFVWNQNLSATVAASGVTDFGWTDQGAPPGLLCTVSAQVYFSGAPGDTSGANLLKIAVKGSNGVVTRDFIGIAFSPFYSSGVGSITGAFAASTDTQKFGCSIDNKSGATAGACRISVLCL